MGTVAAIVEAAARILEGQGHAGFSTNSVAELAGVSIGSLYQYFPGKDALIGALITRETELLLRDAEAALDRENGMDGLSILVSACIAHQFRRPRLARLLDFEEARLLSDQDVIAIKDRFAAILGEMIRRPGIPTQDDDATAVRDVIAIIKGMVDAAGESADDHANLQGRVEKAVFGYLGCGPRAPSMVAMREP